jgi:hypothetical protein
MSWGLEAQIKELKAENKRLRKFAEFVAAYVNTPESLRRDALAVLEALDKPCKP